MRRLFSLLPILWLASASQAATNWDVESGATPSGSESVLFAVAAVSADEAWAVGIHQNSSYENGSLVAHFQNGSWSVIPTPNPSSCTDGNVLWGGNALHAIAIVSPTDIWAAGEGCYGANTLIEHWNGTSWSIVPSPNPLAENAIRGLAAVSENDVWAVGYTSESIGAGTLVEHWDGTRWSVVPAPHAGTGGELIEVAAVSANDVWAVGSYYDDAKDVWETLVEHWDGTEWSVVPSPSPGTYQNALQGLAVVAPDNVWAVGSWSSGDGERSLVEHWDGVRWSVVPSPNVETGYSTTNSLRGVAAVSANDIWAGGMFQSEHTDVHQHRTLLMHWDGSSWSVAPVPSPGKSAELIGIAASPAGQAWGVGIYSDYPIDIYDGHYTLAQSLVLSGGTPNTVAVPTTPLSGVASLGAPSPNPSRGQVSFSLHLPSRGRAALEAFDLRGRKVASIFDGMAEAGDRVVTWNGLAGASGKYFVRLSVEGRVVGSRSVTLVGADD